MRALFFSLIWHVLRYGILAACSTKKVGCSWTRAHYRNIVFSAVSICTAETPAFGGVTVAQRSIRFLAVMFLKSR